MDCVEAIERPHGRITETKRVRVSRLRLNIDACDLETCIGITATGAALATEQI